MKKENKDFLMRLLDTMSIPPTEEGKQAIDRVLEIKKELDKIDSE